MATASLDHFVAVPLSTDLYQEVAGRYPNGVATLIEDVVRDFLDRTAEDFANRRPKRGNGVRWDNVYVPDKTRIRTKHHGEYKYADIKGDKIILDGKEMASFSQLASRMRDNTSVNAWLHLEIMRPGDHEWHRADILRRT